MTADATISSSGPSAARSSLPGATPGGALSEDWLAVGFGLALVAAAFLLYAAGSSLAWLAVTPPPWSRLSQLAAHFATNWPRYLAQLIVWEAVVGITLGILGFRLRDALAGFTFVYAAALVVFSLGQWTSAVQYNLEPPLVGLIAGLLISNLGLLPRRLEAGFRVEFYVKLGIVFLGATLPFSLLVWGGSVALLQASAVSVATFLIIFWVARKLGLDRRFAATLGAGGAICGVSAAIAIGGAVGARRQDTSAAIAIVVLWAIVTLLVLPFVADALHLSAGVGGADRLRPFGRHLRALLDGYRAVAPCGRSRVPNAGIAFPSGAIRPFSNGACRE